MFVGLLGGEPPKSMVKPHKRDIATSMLPQPDIIAASASILSLDALQRQECGKGNEDTVGHGQDHGGNPGPEGGAHRDRLLWNIRKKQIFKQHRFARIKSKTSAQIPFHHPESLQRSDHDRCRSRRIWMKRVPGAAERCSVIA